MFYLKSGDMNNAQYLDALSKNSPAFEDLMVAIEKGVINYSNRIDSLFSVDADLAKDYKMLSCLLTIADCVKAEDQMDIYQATAYYFCFIVNFMSFEHKLDKHIPSSYLAIKTAQAWDWDYAEYLDSSESLNDQLSAEMVSIPIKFPYILNDIVFQLPIVKVKKGFLRKKDIGFMLNTDFNSYGVFTVGNNTEKYKLPKSYIMDLMDDGIIHNESFIFKEKTELFWAIDKTGSASIMLDVLYINNFFSIASFTNESGNIWVDKDDDLLYVEDRYAPTYNEGEENVRACWERLKEHLYRALTFNNKLYISYLYNNNVALLSS